MEVKLGQHVTEVLAGIKKSAVSGEVYMMTTTCQRPEVLKPWGFVDQV